MTPFSTTSNTKLLASCKNVLLEMLDKRLKPLISEIEERLDELGIPNLPIVPVLDFKVEVLSDDKVSLFGLPKTGDALLWLYPFVPFVPFISSLRVFDLDKRFLKVPKIVVFLRSRPRCSRLPDNGSADNSLFCWIMLIFTFKLLAFGFMGVDVIGDFAEKVGDALLLS